MALLMTPTLWNSIDWLNKCPVSWKARAYQSLSDMLNRKWTGSPAIERGMAFEKKICSGENPIEDIAPDLQEKFTKVYDMIHADGHEFQHKSKKIVEVDGKEFCLYGRLDVYFPNLIEDIKTTGNYRGKKSYLDTWQHKMYCYIEHIADFKYLVFELNDASMLKDIHIVEYWVDSFSLLEEEVLAKLKSVLDFIRTDKKLVLAYLKKFNQYN